MEKINVVDNGVKKDEEGYNTRNKAAYHIIKKLFDFICSFAASIILVIPCIIISVIIFCADPGNPFFVQKRVGKDKKDIYIVKFRSMKRNSDDLKEVLTTEEYELYLKEFKLNNDPRLLPYNVGNMIRKLSIDEIPQIIFNVLLKRDMSLIGPRPILKDEMELNYTQEEQELLTSVKPGLTGYWQAYGRNNIGYSDGKRQQMELYYARNCGIWLDIKILFKTVQAVLKSEGAK